MNKIKVSRATTAKSKWCEYSDGGRMVRIEYLSRFPFQTVRHIILVTSIRVRRKLVVLRISYRSINTKELTEREKKELTYKVMQIAMRISHRAEAPHQIWTSFSETNLGTSNQLHTPAAIYIFRLFISVT